MYDNLKAEMARNNLTGVKMSDILHITHQSFYKKIHGETDFKLNEMVAIQNYLKSNNKDKAEAYTLDYLFKE